MNGPDEPNKMDLDESKTPDEFEQALARALRRVEVRAEMSAKFLAIADQARQEHEQTGRMWITPKSGGKLLFFPRPRAWMGGALAAMLAIGVFAGQQIRERHERQQVADQQFATATRIESMALERTRQQLASKGISLEQ